ncbi:hypothetical protein PVAG01_07522 [Phlyctema vagabunda]|uniref:Uncharacterized protein n=1 Tax=Phlyctema vagabunda TaxID=108571 RepID=A0ABR4PCN5_9HELO
MTMPSMQQRMQPPTSSTPQPRASPYGIAPQGTPPNAATQQSQFSTPQPQSSNPALQQTPNQQQSGGIITPQTPNFPPGAQGTGGLGSQIATPLSPGSEAREKERVSLLLEINGELLRASIRIQSVQKEITANTASSPDAATAGEKEVVDKEKAEKDKAQNHKDWNEYMRRLQCNLAYLAAIADRSHKPSSQIPPHPGIMSAPPTRKPNSPSTGSPVNADVKSDHGEGDEERDTTLKELYERLQALFPGVDPKKDPQAQAVKKTQQVPAGDQNQAMLKAQMQQRMVQEQQAKQQQQLQQQQAQAQAQAQAMAGRS